MLLLTATVAFSANAQVVKVSVVQKDGQWMLEREGEPYYIKGAGGQDHLDKLKEIGGNSFRTWSVENAEEYLDEAHKRGLTVMMGLWVGHERHGFDYNDTFAVRRQLEYFTKRVKELKDHPALLLWGVGNEVDLFYSNTKVWDAVQDIAKMIHEVDPNHPTCTVTAGLDSVEVDLIKTKCPDIDIYGVNTYGDIAKAIDKIGDYGWNGPYIIAEYGVNGHWEVAKTEWDAPIEQSSTEKAEVYAKRYSLIKNDSANCLGAYAFLWGQKQETTSTWYGLFSRDGESSESIDVLEKEWTGKQPKNSAPSINNYGIYVNDAKQKTPILDAGQQYIVKVDFKDPDGDKLRVFYGIVPESQNTKSGGDAESEPEALFGFMRKKSTDGAIMIAPPEEGGYRLFITAHDKNGHVAYVNIPFYVKPAPSSKSVRLKTRELQFEF